MTLSLLCILVFNRQSSIEWQADIKSALSKAESEDKLVLVFESSDGDALAEKALQVLDQDKTSKALNGFLAVKKKGDRALVRLWDKDRANRGLLVAPFTQEIVVSWAKTAQDVWKKHEMLVFRSKGRPDETSTARLAFSYAARLQTPEAKAQLDHLARSRGSEDADLALTGLANAYEAEKNLNLAADTWLKLETQTRNPGLHAMASVNLGRLWKPDRPDQARAKFKAVAESNDAPEVFKWFAKDQLEQMSGLSK